MEPIAQNMDDVCDLEAKAVADGFEEGKKWGSLNLKAASSHPRHCCCK